MNYTIELTKKEMNVLAKALQGKIKQLENDVKGEYTPDTKIPLRQIFRKELTAAKQLTKKIRFASTN